jgi:glycosyltransferase involved in cell wall biosynthesis
MKAGKPIMATDVPSHRLLLDETVAVFASPEPEQLAIAIHELAGDTEKRRKMGAAGRRLFEKKYNFNNYRHQLSACYKFALSR